MDPAKARAALQLIEYISDRLTQTRLLFASDAEHKKTFHGEAAQAVRDWRRSSVCMFPGCDQRTITASHTLQRAGPISPLLEDDHVLTPRSYKGRLSMVKIGGAEASTFPGYCAGHESAFSSFERARRIRSETDLALQVFRSLCREIRRKEFDLARLGAALKAERDQTAFTPQTGASETYCSLQLALWNQRKAQFKYQIQDYDQKIESMAAAMRRGENDAEHLSARLKLLAEIEQMRSVRTDIDGVDLDGVMIA